MNLKEQLFEAVKPFLVKEGIESSKEIIANNSTSFDDMGMAHTNPGEFASEEITDQENLVNTAKMSNDNDFNKDETVDAEVTVVSIMDKEMPETHDDLGDVVNLGNGKEMDYPDEEHEHYMKFHKIADMFESAKNEYLQHLKESDYAGNLAYNPDKRLNPSDILNAVKNAVKPELAPALSVNKEVDANEEPSYVILNIDEKELPEKIEIDTNTDKKVVLKRDGKAYKFDK